ncbi:MAG: hypothetical protein R3F48_11820 [Candidatus Zixiibacteriota bacterium]
MFDIPGSLQWEYLDNSVDGDLIFIHGIADTGTFIHAPVTYTIPDGDTLCLLEFSPIIPEMYLSTSIDFFWKTCEDNTIMLGMTGSYGGTGISNHVFKYDTYYLTDISLLDYELPGEHGAPDVCFSDSDITRICDFYNGYLRNYPGHHFSDRGDINLNGLSYEIADWVMLTNYFLWGDSAFIHHVEQSRENSDVNADGILAGIEDDLYLVRVIMGEVLPYSEVFPHEQKTITFTHDFDTKTVSYDCDGELGAILLKFDGIIQPTLEIPGDDFLLIYDTINGNTNIIILPNWWDYHHGYDPDARINIDGPFLSYSGEGTLLYADAADYEDHTFMPSIAYINSTPSPPFGFAIGTLSGVGRGDHVSIPVYKTSGTAKIEGFDIKIGVASDQFEITDLTPGTLFDSLGEYQWEYCNYQIDQLECSDPICPMNTIRVTAISDMNDGDHHPLLQSVINGTVLFTIEATALGTGVPGDRDIPVSFLWTDCTDNAVAFGETGDSLALSEFVYDVEGTDITDPSYGVPGIYGAPESCLPTAPSTTVRFADFQNGNVHVFERPQTEIYVRIDTISAYLADTAINLDVYLDNPQDTIVGFSLLFRTEPSKPIYLGISPDDTTATLSYGTLTEDWEFISQVSPTGNYSDVRIVGLANSMPPFSNAIMPQENGLLIHLKLHIPVETFNPFDNWIKVNLAYTPEETEFADINGGIIGLDGQQFDTSTVFIENGLIKIEYRVCGDANINDVLDIGDAIYLINYIFRSGPAPLTPFLGDVDCDDRTNIVDVVELINIIFRNKIHGSCWPCY